MRAHDAALHGDLEPRGDALGVYPGDAHHIGELKAQALGGEDVRQLAELVKFDGIELAVGVRGVDAMEPRCVEASHFLPKGVEVYAAIILERRVDGGPDAVKVLAGETAPDGGDVGHVFNICRGLSCPVALKRPLQTASTDR